jgi:hypothetical protein
MDKVRRSVMQMAAALPAAAWVGQALPVFGGSAQPQSDVVLDHVFGELTRTCKDMQTRSGPKGEHLRTVAANLRLLQAHGHAKGIAATFDQRLRRGLPEDAEARFDEDGFRAGMLARGVTMDLPFISLSVKDRAMRRRLVKTHPGFDRHLLDAAHGLEKLALRVDARGPVALASLVQTDEVWLCLGCDGGPSSTFSACEAWWLLTLMVEIMALLFALGGEETWELAWLFGADALLMKLMGYLVGGCLG